jgi:hypothetical protein
MHFSGGIRVNDTTLWVEDSGEKDLPVLLCLHSLFLDRRMFYDFRDYVNGAFRTILPDFRGQGKSAPSSDPIIDMDTWEAAVRCYPFNSQLVTLPDGHMAIVAPQESAASEAATTRPGRRYMSSDLSGQSAVINFFHSRCFRGGGSL